MRDDVTQSLLVMTNLPTMEVATKLATTLVEKRLAACVNVLDGCTSLYRWKGEVQVEREVPVLIKTRAERYAALEQEILSQHPYELPEIVAFPLKAGFGPYLHWLADETAEPD